MSEIRWYLLLAIGWAVTLPAVPFTDLARWWREEVRAVELDREVQAVMARPNQAKRPE